MSKTQSGHSHKLLWWDLLIIFFSINFAIFLIRTDILWKMLTSTMEFEIIGSFIAGLFFTSVFTTAPAIVVLGEIARADSIWLTSIFGALGAVLGDLIIFRFIKDRFSDNLMHILSHGDYDKRLKMLFSFKYFRWMSLFVGGLIIASPFPDELGIGILGISKMKMSWFSSLSLVFNFIGIFAIGLVARSL